LIVDADERSVMSATVPDQVSPTDPGSVFLYEFLAPYRDGGGATGKDS
jgi:hypothetical protein